MGLSLAFMSTCLQPIVVLLLVLITVKIFISHGFWLRKANKRYHPNAGTIFYLFLHLRRLHDFLTDISRKHKTFRIYSPSRNLIFTTDPAIVEHILKTNFKNYGKEKKEDILSRFIAEMEHDPENITYEYLRDITLNFIIAGKDTTAGTLSWFIYLLCKYPSVQEKIFQEVKEATQAREDISINEFTEKITEGSLDKMKYLHAALSETLRLYPAVPITTKSCFSDDTLPDGFTVNKGEVVLYMPYSMGRMAILWGDDADNFQPERWIDDNGSIRDESPFKFTAFQDGPRICLGKGFAYVQMKIFAAVILHFFKFKLSCKSNDVHYKTMITLHIDQGLYVHAYLR